MFNIYFLFKILILYLKKYNINKHMSVNIRIWLIDKIYHRILIEIRLKIIFNKYTNIWKWDIYNF